MRTIDEIKVAYELNEISSDEALHAIFNLVEHGSDFIDGLIGKYTEQKKLALENMKGFKNHPMYPWYDATFNNTLLYVWDLEDIKCRMGLFDKKI